MGSEAQPASPMALHAVLPVADASVAVSGDVTRRREVAEGLRVDPRYATPARRSLFLDHRARVLLDHELTHGFQASDQRRLSGPTATGEDEEVGLVEHVHRVSPQCSRHPAASPRDPSIGRKAFNWLEHGSRGQAAG